MDQEKIGNFIKSIRKKHNLTQKQFADKYNITYQAVSKWENGKNLPDYSLIKQISKDFNVSIDEFYNGKYNNKHSKYLKIWILIIIFIIILGIASIFIFRNQDFKFKILSTNCKNFTISGNIAYNDTKSAIYITNIKYCGGDDLEDYKKIECVLYEKNNDIQRQIDLHEYEGKSPIKLEDFLKQVTFTVDNYEKACKEYKTNSLFLSINATNQDGKITTYEIPIKLKSNC